MRIRDILGFAIIMTVLCWVVVAFAATPTPAIPAHELALPPGYAVHQSLALDRATYGIDGTLEVIEDARITPELQEAMWRVSADPRFVLGDNDPLRPGFDKEHLRDAKLRLLTRDGQVVFEDKFVWPLAQIEAALLVGSNGPVIFVTTDNTTSFGSYKGTATRLLEFNRVDAKSGAKDSPPAYASIGEDSKPAMLIRSLKADWRLGKDVRGAPVIQLITAYPDVTNNISDFIIEYATIRNDEGGWVMSSRTEQGIWESQETWPATAKFP